MTEKRISLSPAQITEQLQVIMNKTALAETYQLEPEQLLSALYRLDPLAFRLEQLLSQPASSQTAARTTQSTNRGGKIHTGNLSVFL